MCIRDRSARISEKIKKKIGIDVSEQTSENQIMEEVSNVQTQESKELKEEVPKTTALKTENKKKEPIKEELKKEKK